MDDEKEGDFGLEMRARELELLKSMYTESELIFEATIDGEEASTENEFSIKMCEPLESEISFELPEGYPIAERPNVLVRVPTLSSTVSRRINEDLRAFVVNELGLNEPVVMDILEWVKERLLLFTSSSGTDAASSSTTSTTISSSSSKSRGNPKDPCSFARYWIYSHHIYSKFKRRNILNLARDCSLSGFSLPGKPGIICVEGIQEFCDTFWDTVKQWNWKKIGIRHSETEKIILSQVDSSRRFQGFNEINMDVTNGAGREFRMNMSNLKEYLAQHQSPYAFNLLFGL